MGKAIDPDFQRASTRALAADRHYAGRFVGFWPRKRPDWVPPHLNDGEADDFEAIMISVSHRSGHAIRDILKGGRARKYLMWRKRAQAALIKRGHSARTVARMFNTDAQTVINNIETLGSGTRLGDSAGREQGTGTRGMLPVPAGGNST